MCFGEEKNMKIVWSNKAKFNKILYRVEIFWKESERKYLKAAAALHIIH
jgi:hypothetical protein